MRACCSTYMKGRGHPAGVYFSPSTVRVSGTELWSSGLATGTFTPGAILLTWNSLTVGFLHGLQNCICSLILRKNSSVHVVSLHLDKASPLRPQLQVKLTSNSSGLLAFGENRQVTGLMAESGQLAIVPSGDLQWFPVPGHCRVTACPEFTSSIISVFQFLFISKKVCLVYECDQLFLFLSACV